MTSRRVLPTALLAALAVGVSAQQTPPQQPTKPAVVFRTATNLVRVDVVVRDKNGNVVKGLKAADFIVAEDNKPQSVTSFDFQEITTETLPSMAPPPAVLGIEQLQKAAANRTVIVAPTKPADTPAQPTVSTPEPTKEELASRRMIILLFDTSSMQPEEIDRAVKSANDYVDHQMAPADLIAIASVGQTLTILHEFTSDRDVLKNTLAAFDTTSGTGFEQPVAPDTPDVTDDTTSTDPADLPLDDTEFGIFNNDRRLRAMRVLCDAMKPIEQKKALLYFSAGMTRSGSDNQVELRAVTNSCNQANTSIYPVDSRGLTAVVPGGAAGRGGGGRGGSSVFSGRAMISQYSSLNASQETLSTLAGDTGGQAFLDTNDFAPAFTRVQRDMSAYYLLGYISTNDSKDGKYRRISVKLKNTANGYKIEARPGYYATADFAHLGKDDRAHQLQDEIAAAVSSTDLPVVATTTWFKIAANKYYVPVSLAIPGSAVKVPTQATQDRKNATIDLLGVVTDEQGRAVGKIQDTLQIPAAQAAALADKQMQYQSGVTLPAGHFRVKVAVRENADGTIGTFEFPISIPDLKDVELRVSPIVLSTQLRSTRGGGPGRGGPGGGPGGGGPPGGGRGGGGGFDPGGRGFNSQRGGGMPFGDQSPNPLLRNGQEIVQSLSHVVTKAQQMYFYYEVYDPALDPTTKEPKLQTYLAFYRGHVKVFETPVVERTTIDAADRQAVIFQFRLPAADFKPGLYTCQVSVIDEVSGKFAFPRLAVYVKE